MSWQLQYHMMQRKSQFFNGRAQHCDSLMNNFPPFPLKYFCWQLHRGNPNLQMSNSKRLCFIEWQPVIAFAAVLNLGSGQVFSRVTIYIFGPVLDGVICGKSYSQCMWKECCAPDGFHGNLMKFEHCTVKRISIDYSRPWVTWMWFL